ncbi:nucleotide disphospho-sugar-binding domain-containing protein [Aeromicrobium sp. CF3.5]|uniref:nucleotide disphospho-sugar-binding domain-containing protein n=1 Tax=Aeromicrobium sp. CF3.5 TaxID=3373078 RepID=UPI003EE66B0F
MRVLFVTWPGNSHLYPLGPLAWALQGSGHEVRVATHSSLTAAVTSLGLVHVPIGDPHVQPTGPTKEYPEEQEAQFERDTEALAIPADESDPWEIFRNFMVPGIWDYAPPAADPGQPNPAVDDLVEYCLAWRPDLVVWDPCMPGAAVAARVCGAAHTRLMWWQDYFAWTHDRWTAAGLEEGEDPLSRIIRPLAERHGVAVDRELLLGQWTLDLLPNGYRLATTTRAMPLRWVLSPVRTELPESLLRPPERPRIALSLGMSQRDFTTGGWFYVPAALEALGSLDVEVIATLTKEQLEDVDSLPPNVQTVDYMPLDQLLPSCSAMVHQGGFGTVAAAARHEMPQLITDAPGVPVVMKYPVAKCAAQYVLGHGAGLILDTEDPSPTAIADSVTRLLTEESFQAGAANVHHDWLAMPGPSDLVPQIERMTARFRTAGTRPD